MLWVCAKSGLATEPSLESFTQLAQHWSRCNLVDRQSEVLWWIRRRLRRPCVFRRWTTKGDGGYCLGFRFLWWHSFGVATVGLFLWRLGGIWLFLGFGFVACKDWGGSVGWNGGGGGLHFGWGQ